MQKKKCNYFENVYTPTQLIIFFGIVASRIYLNLGKKHFFVGKLKENSYQYAYYSQQTKKLFDFVCNNINYRYADYAVHNYKPFVDYNSYYFKIVNEEYIKYITDKKKCV